MKCTLTWLIGTAFLCGVSAAQEPGSAPASSQPQAKNDSERARLDRILSIRRDCKNSSYADEPSIADIFEKSDLVVIGSAGIRMFLDESPFATGTDWDKDKRVAEVRIERVIKGDQKTKTAPVIFVETPQFPLNYATMLVGWRERAIVFLRKADRGGFWELVCKEPVHSDLYPGLPVSSVGTPQAAEARDTIIDVLAANLRDGDPRACWMSAKALRDLHVLSKYDAEISRRVGELVTMSDSARLTNGQECLCNLSCFAPGAVRRAVADALPKSSDVGRRLVLAAGACLPGPEPRLAELLLTTLEETKPADRGELLRGLSEHIGADQSERLAKLFDELSAWEKGMASFALVNVLDERTMPLYLRNIRADQGEMQRYFALQTINTVDGTIAPSIRARRATILPELMAAITKNRGAITEFPNGQLPMAVWRLADGDPTLPTFSNDPQKDADALQAWWRDAESRYKP